MSHVDATALRAGVIDRLHLATGIYTAQPVVDSLLDRLDWPLGNHRLVDPSCGDGMFLERALERLFSVEPMAGPDRIAALVEGWEIHPRAVAEAVNRLEALFLGRGWPRQTASHTARLIVREADFLTQGPEQAARYHVIAGNPPYLRWLNVPEPLRAEYEAVTPDYAQADLLHSFIARCVPLLAADGVVAMVTADRWLINLNAAELRAAIGRHVGIDHLQRLDCATAFYHSKVRRTGTPPRIHPVSVVLRPARSARIPLTRDAVHPDAESLPDTGRMLSDIAAIRLAPWLGKRGRFVVDRETARQLPPECLVPAVHTKDIVDGQLGEVRLWAVRTHPDVEPPREVLDHLTRTTHLRPLTGKRHKVDWLPPETWHSFDLDRPSLLVPRIVRSLKPVRLPPGILPIDHGLSIVAAGAATLDRVEKALTSPLAQSWLCTICPRLDNGFFSLTTGYLRRLPAKD